MTLLHLTLNCQMFTKCYTAFKTPVNRRHIHSPEKETTRLHTFELKNLKTMVTVNESIQRPFGQFSTHLLHPVINGRS